MFIEDSLAEQCVKDPERFDMDTTECSKFISPPPSTDDIRMPTAWWKQAKRVRYPQVFAEIGGRFKAYWILWSSQIHLLQSFYKQKVVLIIGVVIGKWLSHIYIHSDNPLLTQQRQHLMKNNLKVYSRKLTLKPPTLVRK